jgi:enoyl-CoA hydratase/carnithine racemase
VRAAAKNASLDVRVSRGIARLTLCRPRRRNRVDVRLAQALCEAAEAIDTDDSVTAVVVAARGASFCAGIEDGGSWEQDFDWAAAVGRLSKPVIAQIQGDAIAEGLELALACDLRLASDRARFAMPQVDEGRLPRHGGSQRLPRTVGRTRAFDLLFTGRMVGAREAERIGLITRRVAHADLARRVRAMTQELRRRAPIALRYAKEAVLRGSDMSLGQGIALEEDLYALLQSTTDRQEGVRAFSRKRAPVFRGR